MAYSSVRTKYKLSSCPETNFQAVHLLTNNARTQDHPEPVAALSSGDIEWQWASPPGTVSNVKMRADKTPLQQMKKPCKSISPVSNNFPRKRKLIKIEEIETEHASAIIATDTDSSHFRPVGLYEPTSKCELEAQKENRVDCFKEEYCTLFGDDEDAMDDCLIQCSQYVEENLSQNSGSINAEVTTPRRITRVHSAFQNTSSVRLNPSHSNLSNSNTNAAMKQCFGISAAPCEETKVSANTHPSCQPFPNFVHRAPSVNNDGPNHRVIHPAQGMDEHITVNKSMDVTALPSKELTSCGSTGKYEINDSFDDILVTFCEENNELLSQPSIERHLQNENNILPLNLPKLQSSPITATTKTTESRSRSTTLLPQDASINIVSGHSLPNNCNVMLDDDFLQPDLLKLLETVEANSQPRPVSSLQKCTPAEIENKRRQAKIKLEQKKIAMTVGVHRLPNTGVMRR